MTASRVFSSGDQAWFAAATGDYNPLHMDEAFASRNFPGRRVVHGVHALLWALESQADWMDLRPGLKVSFIKPILLDETVSVERRGDGLQLNIRDEPVCVIAAAPGVGEAPSLCVSDIPPHPPARDRSGQDLSSLCGRLRPPGSAAMFAQAFPGLADRLGGDTLQAIGMSSTLVGMECPGLYSILSQVELWWDGIDRDGLSFAVLRHDQRFNRVDMQVLGAGLCGRVSAFVGEAEAQTSNLDPLGLTVSPDAFRGQTPLIIGAGSGLGAATARLVRAGGGRPVLGFRRLDPNAVSDPEAPAIVFDVTAPEQGLQALSKMGWEGEQLYYFASPRIFRRQLEPYQSRDLADFIAIFVDGFYETVRGVLRLKKGAPLTIFYPSTVALESSGQDLFEYRIAKAAGEAVCERLRQRHRNLRIVTARLPRIETRQTRSFIRARAESPEAAMADLVRQVQAGADT